MVIELAQKNSVTKKVAKIMTSCVAQTSKMESAEEAKSVCVKEAEENIYPEYHILNLPEELLMYFIFPFLGGYRFVAGFVCKKWRQIYLPHRGDDNLRARASKLPRLTLEDDVPFHFIDWIMKNQPYAMFSQESLKRVILYGCMELDYVLSKELKDRWRSSYNKTVIGIIAKKIGGQVDRIEEKGPLRSRTTERRFAEQLKREYMSVLKRVVAICKRTNRYVSYGDFVSAASHGQLFALNFMAELDNEGKKGLFKNFFFEDDSYMDLWYSAAKAGQIKVFEWLAKRSFCRENCIPDDLAVSAAMSGSIASLEWLQSYGVPIKTTGVLRKLIEEEHLEAFKHFLGDEDIPNFRLEGLFALAAKASHPQPFFDALLQYSGTVSSRDFYMLGKGNHLNTAAALQKRGQPLLSSFCNGAAKGNHISLLKWAREVGCGWTSDVTRFAAKGDNIELLEWALINGCPLHLSAIFHLIYHGRGSMLSWISDNRGCLFDASVYDETLTLALKQIPGLFKWIDIPIFAAKEDRLGCYLTACAAIWEKVDILEWLLTNGCPCGESVPSLLARANNVDALKMVLVRGVPYSKNDIMYNVAKGDCLAVAKWAIRKGFVDFEPSNRGAMSKADDYWSNNSPKRVNSVVCAYLTYKLMRQRKKEIAKIKGTSNPTQQGGHTKRKRSKSDKKKKVSLKKRSRIIPE